MRGYTLWIVVGTVALAAYMFSVGLLSWGDIGNNLVAGGVTVPLTVSLVVWITERERKRLDGLWASEVIFMPLIDVRLLIIQAARFILSDAPPGVEASEKWMPVAEELSRRRGSLGPLLSREILLPVVELENELRRVEYVTARGAESRKQYASDLFSLWGRYHGLMNRMLLPGQDDLRRDLLTRPRELERLQSKYGWDESGSDPLDGPM